MKSTKEKTKASSNVKRGSTAREVLLLNRGKYSENILVSNYLKRDTQKMRHDKE